MFTVYVCMHYDPLTRKMKMECARLKTGYTLSLRVTRVLLHVSFSFCLFVLQVVCMYVRCNLVMCASHQMMSSAFLVCCVFLCLFSIMCSIHQYV